MTNQESEKSWELCMVSNNVIETQIVVIVMLNGELREMMALNVKNSIKRFTILIIS